MTIDCLAKMAAATGYEDQDVPALLLGVPGKEWYTIDFTRNPGIGAA